MALLLFNDNETTGLDFINDEVWQVHFLAARTGETRAFDSFTRLITHDTEKMKKLPEKFQKIHYDIWSNPDYTGLVRTPFAAMKEFLEWREQITQEGEKAHFIAANPTFDSIMLMNNQIIPWSVFYQVFDYHLIDIEAFALGWLRHQELNLSWSVPSVEALTPRESFLPFKSDDLSKALGIYNEDTHRHDAISDTEWLVAMWKAMNGGKY